MGVMLKDNFAELFVPVWVLQFFPSETNPNQKLVEVSRYHQLIRSFFHRSYLIRCFYHLITMLVGIISGWNSENISGFEFIMFFSFYHSLPLAGASVNIMKHNNKPPGNINHKPTPTFDTYLYNHMYIQKFQGILWLGSVGMTSHSSWRTYRSPVDFHRFPQALCRCRLGSFQMYHSFMHDRGPP